MEMECLGISRVRSSDIKDFKEKKKQEMVYKNPTIIKANVLERAITCM